MKILKGIGKLLLLAVVILVFCMFGGAVALALAIPIAFAMSMVD